MPLHLVVHYVRSFFSQPVSKQKTKTCGILNWNWLRKSILKINQTAIIPRAKLPNKKSFRLRVVKFHEINKTAVNTYNHYYSSVRSQMLQSEIGFEFRNLNENDLDFVSIGIKMIEKEQWIMRIGWCVHSHKIDLMNGIRFRSVSISTVSNWWHTHTQTH